MLRAIHLALEEKEQWNKNVKCLRTVKCFLARLRHMEYPYLEEEDVRQSLQYAAWLADETVQVLEMTSARIKVVSQDKTHGSIR